jgi:hypothetical protein
MSYRIMQKFWLDLDKPDHEEVNEIVHTLKQTRAYSKAIRDGLRLIFDLRAGRLDILFELFPWVRAEFLEYMASAQPQQSDREMSIEKQLARIEELLVNGEPMSSVPDFPNGVGEPKKMTVPQIAAPMLEDDDANLLVVSKAKSSGNAAQNFLASAFALQG